MLQKSKSNVASAPLEATMSHVRGREQVEVGEEPHVQSSFWFIRLFQEEQRSKHAAF